MRKLDVLKLELLQERMKELEEERMQVSEEILLLEQQLIKVLEKEPRTLNRRKYGYNPTMEISSRVWS